MLQIVAMKIRLAFIAAILSCVSIVRGDEQLFGFVRRAETLPAHRWELYQFDRAVDALKENGIEYGIVNAGGDLRTFGPASQLIHLRHPTDPTRVAGAVRLRERAMATSGIYFERRKHHGRYVSPLLDGRSGQTARELISVSVAAAECMAADALTKVVFALREEAAGLLAQYGADALLLERDGAPSWMFHSPCDTGERTRFD